MNRPRSWRQQAAALRLCVKLKLPPHYCRTHPRASLRELESNKFCRHQAVYSPAGTARKIVSSRRGDSKGGHIGVSPFGVFFFCHFFLHKQKEMAHNSRELTSKTGGHGGPPLRQWVNLKHPPCHCEVAEGRRGNPLALAGILVLHPQGGGVAEAISCHERLAILPGAWYNRSIKISPTKGGSGSCSS